MTKQFQSDDRQNDADRRRELADFLKTRRARVKPQAATHVAYSRRRTPGLRREEVAEMAGVSSSWYTWLEQARDIRPSREFLVRLSKVLRLNSLETNHLFDLAGLVPHEEHEANPEAVPPTLERLVHDVLRVPALVMNERLEYIAWNRKFKESFFDLSKVPKERRTLLDLVFTLNVLGQPRQGKEWKEDARRTVAEVRWSIGKQIGSPWVKDLVTRLSRESPEFAQLWQLHDVQERKTSKFIDMRHEKRGRRAFVRSIYIPVEADHLRLVILNPVA